MTSNNHDTLNTQLQELERQYAELRSRKLNLDLTRGKPAAAQLDLSNALDGILDGHYKLADGTDLRNYGGLDGIDEAKRLGAELLDVAPENVLVGGNASLTLMYHIVLHALHIGVRGPDSAWARQGKVKFLCPSPGYDRHFAICEELGIDMIAVPMDDDGPDMDRVEQLVRDDPMIKGIWCVPKYSNPTGCTYSDAVVDRIARLATLAGEHFRVIYDNAYAVHDLVGEPPRLASIMQACERHGTQDSVIQIASTSKITFAGAGLAFMAASKANLDSFKKHLGLVTIGPDKVNQQRHALFLKDRAALNALMQQHAAIIRPKFDCVIDQLEKGLGNRAMGRWNEPRGGYFVSFYTRPGLAGEVVRLAAEAGVKLTPAGAAFPYGKDPEDSHIRLAPTFPAIGEVEQAMQVFVICVQLATLRRQLSG
jgi:DNA-binding transcriptional MocR family regulator